MQQHCQYNDGWSYCYEKSWKFKANQQLCFAYGIQLVVEVLYQRGDWLQICQNLKMNFLTVTCWRKRKLRKVYWTAMMEIKDFNVI